MQQKRLSIVFAGAGTGGHLFPAIAIADEIRKTKPDTEITFIGTRHKMEARIVPEHGFKFETIWVSGFRRKLTIENILFPVKFIVALVQSFVLMKKIRPHVVVGTGGYVCGPPVFVASLLGIPTLIQEQNSYPGVTTRLLASHVNEVHLSFKNSQRYLKRSDNVRISGNPTRESVGRVSREDGALHFSIDPGKRTLLVFGGSLGASSINNAVLKILPQLISTGIQVVWQTGSMGYPRIEVEANKVSVASDGLVKVYTFIDKMEFAYAACDLTVCRAGATTISELTKAGVASILIPYPQAAADHQTENARAMVETGAAVMIRDVELDDRLLATVETLMSDSVVLETMRTNALSMGNPDATVVLARAVVDLANTEHGRPRKNI